MSDPEPDKPAIQQLIQDFTCALDQNSSPDILAFLDRAPHLDRLPLLAELVRLMYSAEWARGELPTVQRYETLLPDYQSTVREALLTSHSNAPRYVLLRELGRGNYGVVFMGQDNVLGRQVAIKVLHPQHNDDPRRRDSFLNELRIAAQFTHPNIVHVYDIQKLHADRRYAVLEYVEGEPLTKRIARAQMPVPEVVRLAIAIVDALAYAQRRGLQAHRDLKPDNILLDKFGAPHIADFGLALSIADGVVPRLKGGGTNRYMAPEQIRHGRDGSPELLDGCDIWAVGVMLYEMLTGTRPFKGGSEEELYSAIEFHPPLPPRRLRDDDAVDEELENICLRCLAKSAFDRYRTAKDLKRALQRWIDTHQSQPMLENELRCFDDLLSQHRHAPPRPALLQAVTDFTTRQSHGVMLVIGPMGTGKTSFLVHLFHLLADKGGHKPAYFFYRRGATDPDRCIRHIYAAIALEHGLITDENARLPLDPDAAARRLELLLRQLSGRVSAATPQFILIDGLDEAERDSLGKTAFDRLECELPAHVYVLATTRAVSSVIELSPEIRNAAIDLTDPDRLPYYRREVRDFLRASLPETVVEDRVVEVLASHADANFLVAKLLVNELKASATGPDSFNAALALVSSAQTADQLDSLYELCMRRLARHEDAELLRCMMAALCTIAFAAADLPQSLLITASGIGFASWLRAKEALREWLHVVAADNTLGHEERIRVFHATFQRFLERYFAAERQKTHVALAHACHEWRTSTGLAREYSLRFVVPHLVQAGRLEDLVSLSQDYELFEAMAEAGMLGSLKSGLDQIVQLLRAAGKAEAHFVEQVAYGIWAHLPFVSRHPSSLFQCLWNALWWHDCPDPPPQGIESQHDTPKLYTFMERWRAFKDSRTPGFIWLRAVSPPAVPNGAFSKFEGHMNAVSALDVSPDGAFVVSAALDKSLRLWHFHTGLTAATPATLPERIDSLRFCAAQESIVGGGSDGNIYVWDSRTLKVRREFQGHTNGPCVLAISSDGRRLVTAGGDGCVHLWNIPGYARIGTTLTPTNSAVNSVAFDPNGQGILFTQDGTLYEWTLPAEPPAAIISDDAVYASVETTVAGNRVALAHIKPTNDPTEPWVRCRVYTRDALQGLGGFDRHAEDFCYRLDDAAIAGLTQFAHDTADCRFSPDGNSLLLSGGDTTQIECLRLPGTHTTVSTFTGRVISPGFASNTHVVLGTIEGTIEAWNLSALEHQLRPCAPRKDWRMVHGSHIAMLSGTPYAICMGFAEEQLEVWDATAARCVRRIRLATGEDVERIQVLSFSTSRNGNRLVAGLASGGISVLDLGLNDEAFTVVYPFSDDNTRPAPVTVQLNDDVQVTMDQPENGITAIAVSANGGLVCAGTAGGHVALWDGEPHTKWACMPHTSQVRAAALSHDERHIATVADDCCIHLLDASDGTIVRTFEVPSMCKGDQNVDQIIELGFAPDDRRLGCGSLNGWFRWLNLTDGSWITVERLLRVSTFESLIDDRQVGFSLTGSLEGITLTSRTAGKECAWLPMNQPVVCKFAADGECKLVAVLDDCLRFYVREGNNFTAGSIS